MKRLLSAAILLLILVCLVSCNKRLNEASDVVIEESGIDVSAFGEANTLDIVSWNIEFFPMHSNTVVAVSELIRDIDADIYALQEIEEPNQFERLLDSLNYGESRELYDGVLHGLSTSLRTGMIYKADIVDILSVEHLFVKEANASYEFASRLPLKLLVEVNKNGVVFDFNLIVLHLKAELGNPADRTRRRDSILRLSNYVNDQIENGSGDPDYIVAGDWNDLLDDSGAENIFQPFLDMNQRYRFVSAEFAGSPTEYTYIGGSFNSLIDHIMVTTSIDAAYDEVEVQVLKVDQEYPAYLNEVSDHRPIGVRFDVF